MFHVSEDRNISLKLSEVLSDIGVNERMVQMRRKCTLVKESFVNFLQMFSHGDAYRTIYYFGSQSEGSTTLGLQSDLDTLQIDRKIYKHVIQDLAEWKPNVINLLMVQDETTSPGYCFLQLFRTDMPQAATDIVSDLFLTDDKGRMLYKNTRYNTQDSSKMGFQKNGPASTLKGSSGEVDVDFVKVLHCESWPLEGRGWLDRQCVGNWPSEDIKKLAMSKGCFLVPVNSKCNNLHDVEWRISTSIAERLMMFDLNTTQIGCYVMMKLISKTFFIMNGESTITSFMCKCILFHCIESTHAHYWRDDNLFSCLMKCLCTLHVCVRTLTCPHFIIPTNNLMAHRINSEQQRYLMTVLNNLICFNTDMLSAIHIDDFGKRFQMKLTKDVHSLSNLSSQLETEITIVFLELLNKGRVACAIIHSILNDQRQVSLRETASKGIQGLHRLQSQYRTFSDIAVEACTYLLPLLCSFVGSILASFSVYTSNSISPMALRWLTVGFDSDVSSSRLKLASAFYCIGDINNAELTLRELEHTYTDVVIPVCVCVITSNENHTL